MHEVKLIRQHAESVTKLMTEREFPISVDGSNWTKSTELGHTFTPNRDVDLIVGFPCRSDSESERLGCDNESESESDILQLLL